MKLKSDSQIIYNKRKNIIRLTGPFYKNKNKGKIIDMNKKIIIKTSLGDGINGTNYSTDIIFINNKSISDRNYYIENYPSINQPINNMTVHVNFDNITKYLLIQRLFNNYYIITGIIFLIIGIILCFFGSFKTLTITIVCIIFGEFITFIFFELIIGINEIYYEFLLLIIGLVIGGLSLYFCWKYIFIYNIILGLTSGTIFGIYLLEIYIFPSSYYLIYSIFIDTLLISNASFLVFTRVVKKYNIYLNSLIGGYIFVRGLSILLFKYLRYRELQLIIYFAIRSEWEFFNNKSNDELNWNLFWIYDILIVVVIIISIIFYKIQKHYYFSKRLNSQDDEDYFNENETEKLLNKEFF